MGLFQIFGNRHDLAEHEAIVQFQHRRGPEDILVGKFRLAIFRSEDVDVHAFDIQPLFQYEHAYETRVGTKAGIKLHVTYLLRGGFASPSIVSKDTQVVVAG